METSTTQPEMVDEVETTDQDAVDVNTVDKVDAMDTAQTETMKVDKVETTREATRPPAPSSFLSSSTSQHTRSATEMMLAAAVCPNTPIH